MALYGKPEYWDERYRATSSRPYDWYQNYGSLRHLLSLEALMASTKIDSTDSTTATATATTTTFPSHDKCRVLILGCGNSTFAGDMVLDGWKGKITNIDFSSVVTEQMKSRFDAAFCAKFRCQPMEFVCADITSTKEGGLGCFDDESFDLIICKGTFDAILCSSGSVGNAKRVVAECSRVLAKGHGVFFLVSYGNPDSRVVFLEHNNDLSYYWKEVSIHTVGRATQSGTTKKDYVYICRKGIEDATQSRNKRASQQHQANEENTANPTQIASSSPADSSSKED